MDLAVSRKPGASGCGGCGATAGMRSLKRFPVLGVLGAGDDGTLSKSENKL